MSYKLTDEQREFVMLARELGKKRAALPDDQRVLLDSPKFNGPIGRLDDEEVAVQPGVATPENSANESNESIESPRVSESKP